MAEIVQFRKKNYSLEDRCAVQSDLLTASIFGYFQQLFNEPSLDTIYNQSLIRFEHLMKKGYVIGSPIYEMDLDLWENHIVPKQETSNNKFELLLIDDGYHSLKSIQSMYQKYCENEEIADKYNLCEDLTNQELFQNICYHQIEDYLRYLSNQQTKFNYPNKLKLLNSNNTSQNQKFQLQYSNQLKFKPAKLDEQNGTIEIQSGFIGFDKNKSIVNN